MADKKALITGITGQDGSYLAELLLDKGYIVHGLKRRVSTFNTERIEHLMTDENDPNCKFFTHYGDLSDSANLFRLIQEIKPDEVYNLGAQSHVKVSFDMPEYCADVDGIGALRLLEAIRGAGLSEHTKFYQASTSELYGLVQDRVQTETTPFYPRSPYAVAKLYAFWITKNYREAYNMFAVNGILFNHESPRRPENFVTNKVVRGIVRVKRNQQDHILMGNLDATRDWGHAKDYVYGMWKMLQVATPTDFVLATGRTTTVRQFIDKTAEQLQLSIIWRGIDEDETGYCPELDRVIVKIDKRYFRPSEVDFLHGDYSKAQRELGWYPKISLNELIAEMIEDALKN